MAQTTVCRTAVVAVMRIRVGGRARAGVDAGQFPKLILWDTKRIMSPLFHDEISW